MSPAFYRREALRHRLMAGQETDHTVVEQLRRAAAEYDDLADELEAGASNSDLRNVH